MGHRQRGQIVTNRAGTYSVRYYLGGTRRQEGPFKTRTQATRYLRTVLDEMDRGYHGDVTLGELAERWEATYQAAPATRARVHAQLATIVDAFGDQHIRAIRAEDIAAWRMGLSEGSRHQVHGLMRQVLEAGVRWGYAATNPAKSVPNPAPKRGELAIFRDWEEVERVAIELGGRYGALVVWAVGTGMRPQEWAAVRAEDIDRTAGVVRVERTFTEAGGLVPYGKTDGSRRRIPLRAKLLELDLPERGLLFPDSRGGHVRIRNWRRRYWHPALESAGLPYMRPYAMRHTFAAWGLAAGLNTFTLSRRMGTSLEMIQATYGHLVHDADATDAAALDAFDAREEIELGSE